MVSIAKDHSHVFNLLQGKLSEEELKADSHYGETWIQSVTRKPNQELTDWAYKNFWHFLVNYGCIKQNFCVCTFART